ncbi:hypothetical protein EGW08_008256, partial [Elysia chlorotica]
VFVYYLLVTCYLYPSPCSSIGSPADITTARHLFLSLLRRLILCKLRPLLFSMLSIKVVGGLPFLLLPANFPCRTVFIRSVFVLRIAWPVYLSLRFWTSLNSFRVTPSSFRILSFVLFSFQLTLRRRLYSHISMAWILFCSSCFSVHASQPYRTTGQTRHFRIAIFSVVGIPLSFQRLFNSIVFCFAIAILVLTSL